MFPAMDAAKALRKAAEEMEPRARSALIEQSNPDWRNLYPELSGLVDPDSNR